MQGRRAASAQQTIPYKEMYPDGICKVKDNYFTKTIQFFDINYQLARNEDKNEIFENYCDFLNYFDQSISVQFSFLNQTVDMAEYEKAVHIPEQADNFNDIRIEYMGMLKNQLSRGNNGIIKRKFITFGIEADNLKAAKQKLERIETDILGNFKALGVQARPLNGLERLELLHCTFNEGEKDKFGFHWDLVHKTGLSSKDFIAPTSFDFRDSRTFGMGGRIGTVSFLQILAPELTDRMLADFLDLDMGIGVNIHIKSIDQSEAIKTVKRKITDLDKMKIEEQKKAVRSGYDMDIIPSDLATFGGEAKNLLEQLQSRNERMFLVTVLVMNTADNKQKLDNMFFAAQGIAQKYNCALKRLDFQQEQALMSSVPIGLNQIEIQRGLTTSSTAIFVPFTTQELFQAGDEALYYGLNALSNNMILVDRKKLKNPNGLILGTPGSGKSFSAKREIANAFLVTQDDIIICDPEAQRIASALDLYVNGSLNVFNHRTNVNVNNRIVCYDIKELGKQLKKLGMLIVQDQVWNRVTINRAEHKATRYYVDEFHLLLKEEQTAAYSVEIWKRFRKWGGIPTGITQNVKDLLSSREIENIFENSDFIYMLNQAGGDRQILAKQLNISPHQLSYVTQSGEGEGLLFYGNVIIPFVDRFPKDLKLYSYMTTKPEEIQKDE